MFILKKTLHAEIQLAEFRGYHKAREDLIKEKETYAEFDRQQLLNTFIIGVSNEYENPYIGKVVDFFSSDPVIWDFVTNTEFVFMGAFKPYTKQLFEALLKLSPEERAAVMFVNLYKGKEVSFNKVLRPDTAILSPDEIKHTLMTNGYDWEKGVGNPTISK
ncbi:MAG: hypothetical protein M0R77_00255 [Gammaproteobacteria bacterium]|nr:hypothetical protein [Acholeplasmataceae bacterium]MCK9528986.1 hypothetical protein [Gammaproteobacteria bacterium]